MNVTFATENFQIKAILLNIKEPTLDINHMNVMFATKDFPIKEP